MNPNQTKVSSHRDWFTALALGYLLLPSVVFLLTWVRPGIGISTAVLVGAAFILFLRQNVPGGPRPRLSTGSWFYILGLALVWTWLAGIGGYTPQVSDYEKHNLVYHDLVQQAWPVKYATGAGNHYLCYGLGYYLVPAFIARTIGEAWLPIATFLWATGGVILFFYWLATFSQSSKKTLTIVLVFATTEMLWHLFLQGLHRPGLVPNGNSIFDSVLRLGLGPDYSDDFMSLQFRPQHVIPAWLGAAILYDMFWVRHNARGAGLAWAACWFWSPLMSLGLLLIPLMALKQWRWRDAIEPVNFGGGILLAILAIYFQGHVALTENGPIWKFSSGAEWLVLYPLFLLLQLSPMLFICLVDWKYRVLGDLRLLFWGGFVLLLILPLYKIGYYGDLRLQAATPALLFAGLAASRCIQSAAFSFKRPLFALLVTSQVAGMIYPFGKWCVFSLRGQHTSYSFADTQLKYGYHDLSEFKRDGYDYASQYLGRSDSFAARWLLR